MRQSTPAEGQALRLLRREVTGTSFISCHSLQGLQNTFRSPLPPPPSSGNDEGAARHQQVVVTDRHRAQRTGR